MFLESVSGLEVLGGHEEATPAEGSSEALEDGHPWGESWNNNADLFLLVEEH